MTQLSAKIHLCSPVHYRHLIKAMKSLIALPILSFLISCSGGGSSSSSAANTPAQPATGVFVDSPVAGLTFSTPTQSGITNDQGEFAYLQNEQVSFGIGSVALGSAPAATTVSPLDLVGATSLDEARLLGLMDELVNRLLFLQALDQDGNPDNGIDLTGIAEQLSSESLEFSVSTESFITGDFRRIVNQIGGQYVEPRDATNHLLDSLGQSVTVSLVVSQQTDNNADGVIDYIATFAYDELGRLTEVASQGATSRLSYNAAGNITSIQEFIGEELDSVERFEYDFLERLVITEKEINDEVVSTVTRRYDSVGNLLEEIFEGVYPIFSRASPYLTEVVLASTIFTIPEVVLRQSLDIVRGAIDPSLGLSGLAFSGSVSPSGLVPALTINSTSRFSYLADGTLNEIEGVINGIVERITRLDAELDCYRPTLLTIAPLSFIGLSPLPPFASGVNLCDSNQEIEIDARGRTIKIVNTGFINIVFNSGEPTLEFIYEGDLLVSQTNTIVTSSGTIQNETRYEYDSLNNLIVVEQLRDSELQARRTREYEQRVLSQLP
jgi:YD repeat-containing protein